jgi:hypothetical protein
MTIQVPEFVSKAIAYLLVALLGAFASLLGIRVVGPASELASFAKFQVVRDSVQDYKIGRVQVQADQTVDFVRALAAERCLASPATANRTLPCEELKAALPRRTP